MVNSGALTLFSDHCGPVWPKKPRATECRLSRSERRLSRRLTRRQHILILMNILALDVGTSAVKAAVLDAATSTPVGAIARATYDLDAPVPDAAEVPAQRLWEATAAAARAAMRSSGLAGKAGQDVQAVG